MTIELAALLGFLTGLLIGVVCWLRSHREAEALRIKLAGVSVRLESEQERGQWNQEAEERTRQSFKALASEVLHQNSQSLTERAKDNLESILAPMKERLLSLDGHVNSLEKQRVGAYKDLIAQVAGLRETQSPLQKTTSTLGEALKSPTVRGQWGEIQLRRVVELAGMVNHVAFDEQVSGDKGRPDLIAYLPNGGVLPVDSKVPLASYMDAMEATDGEARKVALIGHAKAMRERVRELAQRQYWDQFESTPDFVVMFVPNETFLAAAFEQDPELLEKAIESRVLISSPINLLALFKAVAYGWQQHKMSENATLIVAEARELTVRMSTFADRLGALGRTLDKSVDAYNKTVGSLQRRLIPAARRFEELGVPTGDLQAPDQISRAANIPEDTGENQQD